MIFEQDLSETVHATQRRAQIVGHRIAEGFELAIREPERLSLFLAFGNVANRRGDEHPILRLHRGKTDLGRKLASVFATPIKVEARTHRTRLRGGEVALAVPAVLAAIAFGNQDFDGSAHELLTTIAEQAFGLVVD